MTDIKTLLAQAGHYINKETGGIVPPIENSVTFARDQELELIGNYNYGRYQNPTHDQVEKIVCELENGKSAKLFASGLAAIAAIFETVNTGEHIVAPSIMYHGAQSWLRRISQQRNIGLTFFDPAKKGSIEDSIEPGKTAIVWLESPVNPTFDVVDIKKAANVAHRAGAILGVDGTCGPPVTTRPLDLGADLVFHSATKYFNGHSDLNAGLLTTKTEDSCWEEILEIRKLSGSVLGSFEAWLLLRGMRTLALRFERCSENAMKIAEFLECNEKIDQVMYPGLPNHPSHKIARKQMKSGYGGMLSILVKGGSDAAKLVASSVRLFTRATSLGGVESLIEHRRTVEGPKSKVPVQLLRLSVGIEDVNDLIDDLAQALDKL